MSLAALEGVIQARLRLDDGVISAVEITPRPAPPVGRLLKGRPAQEAVKLLPRLFSICKVAQSVAALAACEAALNLAPSPSQNAARMLFLLAETAQEHATRLLLDAPLLLDQSPDAAAARSIRHHIAQLAPLVSPDENWIRPGGGLLVPDPKSLADWLEKLRQLILTHVMGGGDVAGLRLADDLDRWSRQAATAPAKALAAILKARQAGLGNASTALMGRLDLDAVQASIRGDAEDSYVRSPKTPDGFCLETGPLSRQCEHPLIQSLQERDGWGFAARFAARLIELSHALTGIALSLPLLETAGDFDLPMNSGEGLGVAEAARGRLIHWVRLQDGRVEDYRLLAPTEWNFHPEGAYALGLKGLAASDGEAAIRLARLQGLALDPCVALNIEVS